MKEGAKQFYRDNLLPFSSKEIEVLSWFSKMVTNIMKERADRMLPKYWKFIKIRAQPDWAFPYTMGDAIVLPELKIREMVYAYCQKVPDLIVSGFRTIFHEAVHLHQKDNPILYQKIYHDAWGFKCVNPEDIQYLLLYKKYWVTNPDGMRINFIMPIVQSGTNGRTDWFLPLIILNPKDPKKTIAILIQLAEVWDKKSNSYKYYTTKNWRTICSLREYNEKFYGINRQLYHPNEIMANLMTDYVVTYKVWTDPAFNSVKFYDIIGKVMSTYPSGSV